MGQETLSSRELFERTVRIWGARPDPTDRLTFRQIAALVLRSGTDQNAAIVGRTIVDFRDYFKSEDTYRWSVRWTRIEKDHPSLYPKTAATVPTMPQVGSVQDMLNALQDEVLAVRKQANEHPIKAKVSRGLGQIPDGGFWYEAQLELPDETELPVPEGVEVKLRWAYRLHVYPCDATLLSYDPLKCTIIFEVQRPLAETQIKNEFALIPCVEQLIQTVAQQLGRATQNRDRAIWRIVDGNKSRVAQPWGGGVLRDKLDNTQALAIDNCLSHDLTFLWGPPGTGKTHTLGRLMASAALAGKRVIAAAISNIAVDQMSLHLIRALEAAGADGKELLDTGRIIRFGYPRDPQVTAEARLFPNKMRVQELRRALHDFQQQLREASEADAELRAKLQHNILEVKSALRSLTKDLIRESRIVLTTAVQTCIEPAISESSFELAVIDEASMMAVPYVVCVGSLSTERVVVTGDFRQLSPIALAQTAAAHRWLHRDAFELAGIGGDSPQHPALAMLQVQRRMQHTICELINKTFYGGKLQSDPMPRTATELPPLPGSAVVFVSLLPEDGSRVEQTVSGSRVNRKSAAVVADLVCRYLDQDDHLAVGVIAPYRDQVSCIRRLLRERSVPHAKAKRLRVGTVHAFQGSEADVVIWDLVETRDHKIGRLYHNEIGERLTNVAISRAQGKLVIVGDADAFYLASGQESVGKKIRAIISRHFYSNSPIVVPAAEVFKEG